MKNIFLPGKIFHNLFEISILMKGISGAFEIIIGFLFLFSKTETIYQAMISLSSSTIASISGNYATGYLINQANSFSLSTKHFIAFYFLFYGFVNIFLVVSLLRGKVWAYPVAMIFFVLFIFYQLHRFFLYQSGLLLIMIIFDAFLIFLTWVEYKKVKKDSLASKIL